MARGGKFGASLQPFGGGTLNLDAAYAIEPLTATYAPPGPGAPPPLEYGGYSDGAVQEPTVPIVGTTPVPPGVLAAPAALKPWQPATAAELAAITARGQAVGYQPTAAAAQATYVRTQAAAAGATQPALDAIRARAVAAGKNPTPEQVLKTYIANQSR